MSHLSVDPWIGLCFVYIFWIPDWRTFLYVMYAHWCISAVMCDVERLVFMALPAATANLGQTPANHIAGNHNQETSLVQISMSWDINIDVYNNNNCYSYSWTTLSNILLATTTKKPFYSRSARASTSTLMSTTITPAIPKLGQPCANHNAGNHNQDIFPVVPPSFQG